MKTLTTIALAVLFCASAARADTVRSTTVTGKDQPKILIGADADFALPIGNYSNANGVGGTLLLKGEYPVLPEVGATLRIGFQFHSDKDVGGGISAHFHSIPVLFGAQYYFMPDHQGLFAAGEVGLFYLMGSASAGGTTVTDSQAKFGMGVGVGYQMKQWNVRINLHSQDVGNFGDLLVMSGGVGYQFAGI
jgi:hypothetical protein